MDRAGAPQRTRVLRPPAPGPPATDSRRDARGAAPFRTIDRKPPAASPRRSGLEWRRNFQPSSRLDECSDNRRGGAEGCAEQSCGALGHLQFQQSGLHLCKVDFMNFVTRSEPAGESDREFAAEMFLKISQAGEDTALSRCVAFLELREPKGEAARLQTGADAGKLL